MITTTAVNTKQPVIALPTLRLVVTVLVAAAAALAGWSAVVAAMAAPRLIGDGAAGAGLVAAISAASLVVLGPWRARPVSTWASLWLAALVLRLFATPAMAYVLYSATPFGITPLLLSVAVTYLVVQLAEAAVMAVHLKRVT